MNLTLVIHGTFARAEQWWRLGTGTRSSFADQLEGALAGRGVAGTVWRPALDAGMSYDDFAWSGENRHRARVAGAARLRASLTELARRMGAREEQPLTVNFVAHSHGGNVVLELLERMPGAIRVGRVVLLGTPLLTVRPALRLFRLVVALIILGFVALYGIMFMVFAPVTLVELVGRVAPGLGLPADLAPDDMQVAALLGTLVVAAYGWIFAGLAAFADLVWRGVAWLLVLRRLAALGALVLIAQLLARVTQGSLLDWWIPALVAAVAGIAGAFWESRQRRDRGVYGPSPRRMLSVLSGRPFVLFTSQHDEADILLKLGAAPRQLYREEVRRRLRGVVTRAAEWLLVRPIVVDLVLRGVEVALERVVFGVPWLNTLFADYEMADLDRTVAYRAGTIMQRIDVTDVLASARRVRRSSDALIRPVLDAEIDAAKHGGDQRHKQTLRDALEEMGRYLKAQVILRHSLYYESPEVTEEVAAVIAGR